MCLEIRKGTAEKELRARAPVNKECNQETSRHGKRRGRWNPTAQANEMQALRLGAAAESPPLSWSWGRVIKSQRALLALLLSLAGTMSGKRPSS